MTGQYEQPEMSLSYYDLNIRRLTNIENANRGLAEHFTGVADNAHSELVRFIAGRDRYLGGVGMENVVPIIRSDDQGGVA